MEVIPLTLKDETSTMPLAERVFIALEEGIIKGSIPSGEVLTEVKLSSQLGVSRTPIREALKRLEQEGLVGIQNSKRVLVLGINTKDVEEIFEIRTALCGLIYSQAVQNCTADDLADIKSILDLHEFYIKHNNIEGQDDCDFQFHIKTYDMMSNQTLRLILSNLHRKIQRYRYLSMGVPKRATAALEEHKAIYAAFVKKDEQAAIEAAVYHTKQAEAHILKKLAEMDIK